MMQEGFYTERNDSLFLMPSMAMEAESYKQYNHYKQYVYTEINDSTQFNVVVEPKMCVRKKNGDIAEVIKRYEFKVYEYEGKRYIPIPETIGNLDFHDFPQEIRDSIMSTMTEQHVIYQRVKLSKLSHI